MLKQNYENVPENQNGTHRKNTGFCLLLAGGVMAGILAGMYMGNGQSQGGQAVNAAVQTKAGSEVKLVSSKKKSDSAEKGNLDVSDIVESAMPSVVSITTKTVQEIQDYCGMYPFGGSSSTQKEVEGSGSGFIVGKNDSELLLVTNNHVIENVDTVSVTFVDDSSYEAQVKGTDTDSDLAVVAVKLDSISKDTQNKISVAVMGDADSIKIGEQVVAIGNALGYGQSVTTGIVSANNRTLSQNSKSDGGSGEKEAVKLIQTDAAINPGNSGGPLLNMNGEVIGINSVKLASSGIEGMGYAIKITDVADKLSSLMNETTREKVKSGQQGSLGIKAASVDTSAMQMYGIPEGVFVSEVTDGGAADQAGMENGGVCVQLFERMIERIFLKVL